MVYSNEDFIRDIEADFRNARNQSGSKKKIRELMDKYGNTVEEIEAYSSMQEWMEFKMANGDALIDSVRDEKLQEERLQSGDDDIDSVYSKKEQRLQEENAKALQEQNKRREKDDFSVEEEEEEEEFPSLDKELFKTVQEKDAELLKRAREHLKKPGVEDSVDYVYIDTEGYISTGVGANVDNKADFMRLDWQKGDRLATTKEKDEAYNHFLQMKADKKYGKQKRASQYEKESDLRLPEATINRLLEAHLKNDITQLRAGIKDFDKLPLELQEVLLDIRYNTGGVTRSKWPKLRKAIDEKKLQDILNNVNRKGIQQSRNDWAKDKIRSIKKL